MLPKNVVFSGGGTRCLLFLPALIELQTRGWLTDVEDCWGTSAGALIATLYMVYRDARKVHDIMFNTDFGKFRDIDITNLLLIHQSWGLDEGKHLLQMIEHMLESAKYKTMSDFKGLHIVVSDLTLNKTIVVDSTTFPDMRVSDAIRASMSLPFFLRPVTSPNGHLWVDGALKHNFPWALLPSDEARRASLGFAFKKEETGAPTTLLQYIFAILHFSEPEKIVRSAWPTIIWFPRPEFPSWYIAFKEEDYTMIKEQSVKTINEWLDSTTSSSRNSESQPLSLARYIPLPVSPEDRTTGSSGNQTPSRAPFRGSSLPQSPYTPLSYRRWSV